MRKVNCWEHKKCGRELGGNKAEKLEVCPASIDVRFNGIHDGENAGRACWVVAGTLCKGQVQGTFAIKHKNCGNCEFYRRVQQEEGRELNPTYKLIEIVEEGESPEED